MTIDKQTHDKLQDAYKDLETFLQRIESLAGARVALRAKDQDGIRKHFTHFNSIINRNCKAEGREPQPTEEIEEIIATALANHTNMATFSGMLTTAGCSTASLACLVAAFIVKEEKDSQLLTKAVTKWDKIICILREIPIENEHIELMLEDKPYTISQMHLLADSLKAEADEVMTAIRGKYEHDQVKDLAQQLKRTLYSRDWAKDLSKKKILTALEERINWCENYIDQVVIDPIAAHEDMSLLDEEQLRSTSYRHAAITGTEEMLLPLREWKAELVQIMRV